MFKMEWKGEVKIPDSRTPLSSLVRLGMIAAYLDSFKLMVCDYYLRNLRGPADGSVAYWLVNSYEKLRIIK